MNKPDLKSTLDNILLSLQNAVATIKQCNDEQYTNYVREVTDALIDRIIAESEEVRSYMPIDDGNK